MGFTFWSFLVALASCSLLILALALFRKHVTLSGKHGAFALILVCVLCILRMFLSYDFSFATGIGIGGVYAIFSDFMLATSPALSSWVISPWEIVLIIWGIGAAIMLFHFWWQYHVCTQSLRSFTPLQSEQIQRISSLVLHDLGFKMNCSILRIPNLHMPGGIGIFHKKILLPDCDYSDDELYYILAHEYNHFRNGDLLLKLMFHFCCCLLWWFPPVHLLQKQITQATEIRCDMAVSENLSPSQKLRYMDTLVQSMKYSRQKDMPKTAVPYMTTLSETASEDAMLERFKILSETPKIKTGSLNMILFTIVTCILFAVSYLFLPLPSHDTPVEEIEGNGGIYIDPERSWLYTKDDGYYLVINGLEEIPVSEFAASIHSAAGVPFKEESNEK